jgi:NTE family protein
MAASRQVAIVFAGGVARGAFEAGAIDVLVRRGIPIRQVVGTSSGALNATMIAAAVRAGRESDATARLLKLWRDEADWMEVFHITLREAFEGRGLSDSKKILQLMREEVPRIATAAINPVGLRIVVGALQGVMSSIDGVPATTFEGVLPFEGEDFDHEDGRERIYTAAAASAAFPLVFNPVEVPGLGQCVDGGVVNDTPVRLATEGGADRVIVITPYPAIYRRATIPRGVDFAAHLVDALIHERLFRDLRDSAHTNATLARLEALQADGTLTLGQLAAVQRALGARPLEIIAIRPTKELRGNPFAGFLHRDLREEYIKAGETAATEMLAAVEL